MQKIDWNYPPPRQGWRGMLDRFIGPGATASELALQLSVPFVAVVGVVSYAVAQSVDWTAMQYVIAGILAFDLVGGVITNATSSAKRWYHRPEQTKRSHLAFVSVHLAHLSLVSLVFQGWQWGWVATAGAYLIAGSVVVLRAQQYLQRPISLLVFSGALMLDQYILSAPPGLEWFLPLFYLKLLVSHLPKEEPYRPASEGSN